MGQKTISQKILLELPTSKIKKVRNKVETAESKAFKDYLQDNYSTFTLVPKTIETNEYKIIYILERTKFMENLTTEVTSVYKILFRPFLERGVSRETIAKNLESFLTLQHRAKRFEILLSVIEIQYAFLRNFKSTYYPLAKPDNLSFLSQELVLGSNVFLEDKIASELLRKSFKNYDITYTSAHQAKHGKHELDTNEKSVVLTLRTIFNSLIRKFQKLNNIDIRTYGSYCSFLLDSKVNYNDIDIYIKDPLRLLAPFMVLSKIFLDLKTEISIIPFIPGHTSLTYNKTHYADCLFIDAENMSQIPYVTIKEVRCIHPILQVVNFFRSLSELRRLSDISSDPENTIRKISALLQYSCAEYEINLSKDLVKIDLDFESIDNGYVLNLVPIFEKIKDYDLVKQDIDFDFLVLSNLTSEMFFRFIKKSMPHNPAIRKQWGALFNEVVVEYSNKAVVVVKAKDNKKQRRVVINEKDIVVNKITEEENSKLLSLLQRSNTLLMSQFTTNFFTKTTTTDTGKVIKTEMSNFSKETTLASFVLSQILAYFDNKPLVKFYFRLLLSFVLQDNDKKDELETLVNKSENCFLSLTKKHKLTGEHKTLTLEPETHYRKQFFYKEQKKTLYTDIQEFLEICIYN